MISALLLVPVVVTGCQSESDEENMPALHGGQEAQMIELSTDNFATDNHITKNVTLIRPGSLIVTLGANPATGFEWEDAVIANNAVVEEQSHVYVEPQTDSNAVGAPGKDVWVFDSLKAGETTINMSYSRPWDGGEKDVWTLTINVSVE